MEIDHFSRPMRSVVLPALLRVPQSTTKIPPASDALWGPWEGRLHYVPGPLPIATQMRDQSPLSFPTSVVLRNRSLQTHEKMIHLTHFSPEVVDVAAVNITEGKGKIVPVLN
jgi:hypothetical protein